MLDVRVVDAPPTDYESSMISKSIKAMGAGSTAAKRGDPPLGRLPLRPGALCSESCC